MVTVIADNGELTTPAHNGVPAGSNGMERPSHYIKDYQEVKETIQLSHLFSRIELQVDFYRSPSCKPLPENLLGSNPAENMQSSVSTP